MRDIAWNEPAQPAIRDDYFSNLIGPEMDADKAGEIVDRIQKRVARHLPTSARNAEYQQEP